MHLAVSSISLCCSTYINEIQKDDAPQKPIDETALSKDVKGSTFADGFEYVFFSFAKSWLTFQFIDSNQIKELSYSKCQSAKLIEVGQIITHALHNLLTQRNYNWS